VISRTLILLLAIFLLHDLTGQENPTASGDSIRREREVRKTIYSAPRKASIMSAIIPGLGQAYNRKFWKIPVIYAGLGGFGYMFAVNNAEYRYYRKHLIAYYDDDPATENTTFYSGEQLQSQKLYYRKLRDFAGIGIGIIYLLNIVDANVDAHLRTFDVSDDLSLQLSPGIDGLSLSQGRIAPGLRMTFTLK
jgi:hypothetical protein